MLLFVFVVTFGIMLSLSLLAVFVEDDIDGAFCESETFKLSELYLERERWLWLTEGYCCCCCCWGVCGL